MRLAVLVSLVLASSHAWQWREACTAPAPPLPALAPPMDAAAIFLVYVDEWHHAEWKPAILGGAGRNLTTSEQASVQRVCEAVRLLERGERWNSSDDTALALYAILSFGHQALGDDESALAALLQQLRHPLLPSELFFDVQVQLVSLWRWGTLRTATGNRSEHELREFMRAVCEACVPQSRNSPLAFVMLLSAALLPALPTLTEWSVD